jgi:geranylgeranyl diphosphate synthase type II
MSNIFLQHTEKYRPKIWAIIKSYLPTKPKSFSAITSVYPRRQGRYLRPAIFLAALQAFGRQNPKDLLTAAALQTAEDWLLIHDDVEDKADLRRKQPAINQLFGDAVSINAGDSLHLIMWQMLLDNTQTIDHRMGLKIANKFSEILFTTTKGQFEELSMIRSNPTLLDIKTYLQIVTNKTATYTTIGPLHLAAILANKEQLIPKADKFTVPWGQAFQIQNDIRNLCRIEESNTNDIREGKRTIPLIYTLLAANKKDCQEITRIYQKKSEDKTITEINYVLETIVKHGGIEHAQFIAKKLTDKSLKAFSKQRGIFSNKNSSSLLADAIILTTTD